MANRDEIYSEMWSISNILINEPTVYFIPDFQRGFVWREEEAKQLLADLSEDTDGFTIETSKLEGYLLGNIVLIEDDENKKIVVDGQQRLTTISLIFKCLENQVNTRIDKATNPADKRKWTQKVGDLVKGYQVLDDSDEIISSRIVHDPYLDFGSYYKKLINNKLSDPEKEAKTSADQNVYSIYKLIDEFLDELGDEQLLKFITYIKNKVKLIVTSAPTETKAFQLFEVLNARGRSLEPTDLIKNLFLKRLNEGNKKKEITQFNTDWKAWVKNLNINAKKRIAPPVFLKQYLLATRGKNYKNDEIFKKIKEDSSFTADNIPKYISDMNKASRIYRAIEMKNYKEFLDDPNMNVLFELLQIKQFHSLLILFYDADDTEKKEILSLATRLGAATLFSHTQTNYLEKLLEDVLKSYHDTKDKKDAYKQLVQSLKDHIDKLAKIMKNDLQSRNFVGNGDNAATKTMVILKYIEYIFNENTEALSPIRGKRITVEHILSKKLDVSKLDIQSDLGFKDEKEKKDYIHKIGNLTLLYNTDNSSISNGKYSEKIKFYEDCSFAITKTIVSPMTTHVKNGKDTQLYNKINAAEPQYTSANGHWTKALIEERSNNIAELMYQIVTQG